MKFRVKEYRTHSEVFSVDNEERGEFSEIRTVLPVPPEEANFMCKICWMETETEDNPKVNACSCKGSIKYVHFQCLKWWLETKMTVKSSDNHHTFSWKQFECDLCQDRYTYQFDFNGKLWSLVDLKRPNDQVVPYIILESLDIEKNSSWIIHTAIFSDPNKKFSLGRGHESDLWINDISVSRIHA